VAWAEWEQLKTEAADRSGTRMRLNQLDGGGSGSGGDTQGDLRVNQKSLAAVGNAAFKLFDHLGRDGKHAKAASDSAASGLKADFELGGALAHVVTRWETQVRTLQDACAHISNHLEFTDKTHRADDEHALSAISKISDLESGFDDRDERR
jgi:hypothetical protein